MLKLNSFGLVLDAILGEVIDALVNIIKDTALWAAEMFDPSILGSAALNVWNSLENHFRFNSNDRARDLVGVGYSGGFLTLGEVLANNVYNEQANTGYNTVSLVGLGGANIQLEGPYRKVLDKMVEIGEILLKDSVKTAEFLSNIRIELDALAGLAAGPAGLASLSQSEVDRVYQELVEGTVESAYQLFIAKAQEKTQLWNGFAPSLAATSNIGVVVNVYGTQDILTKLSVGSQAIGGYRDSLGVYSIANDEKALVNVEIVGASHFDYIRPEEKNQWWKSGLLGAVASSVDWFTTTEDEIWNKTVSDFTADLIGNSQTLDDVEAFLAQASARHGAIVEQVNGKWIIKLPGWEPRA